MQFSVMQQELSDRLGVYDNTVSTDLVKLKRWLNMAQQEITSRANWPFMLAHEIIQTVPDITDGTVSINVGSTSLTFSSGPVNSVANYFIKFSDDSNWYKVTAHTAASTSATITPSYGGALNLSGATYTLRKLWYATSTPLDSILDIKKTASGRIIESANARTTDMFLPLYWDSGNVYQYISSIPDSSGGLQISFIYSPSDIENIQVRGIKKLSDMSADADLSIIPTRWHNVILDYAAFYGFQTIDDTRAKEAFQKAELGVQSMVETFDYDLGRHRVSRSLQTGIFEGPAYMLPPQYGISGS